MSESSAGDAVENEEPSGAARSLPGAHHVTHSSDLMRIKFPDPDHCSREMFRRCGTKTSPFNVNRDSWRIFSFEQISKES